MSEEKFTIHKTFNGSHQIITYSPGNWFAIPNNIYPGAFKIALAYRDSLKDLEDNPLSPEEVKMVNKQWKELRRSVPLLTRIRDWMGI